VKAILGDLLVRDRHEQEARKAILGGTDLKRVGSSSTTTHPSASRHHRPSAPGSRASTIVCSQIGLTT
jgi:hypothetical protein